MLRKHILRKVKGKQGFLKYVCIWKERNTTRLIKCKSIQTNISAHDPIQCFLFLCEIVNFKKTLTPYYIQQMNMQCDHFPFNINPALTICKFTEAYRLIKI